MNKELESALKAIYYQASNYAQFMGAIAVKNFNTNQDIIEKEIKKLEEYKFKYKELEK